MKRYLGHTSMPWEVHGEPITPANETIPTPPELTFNDSFFVDIPQIYEPEGDDLATQSVPNQEDDDDESVQTNEDQAEIKDEPPPVDAVALEPTLRINF